MASPSSPGQKRKVVIIGGGVGGLVAACYLARDGHQVTVLERKFSYREQSLEQGQGIHLSINATRCLDALGMRDEFNQFAATSNKTMFKRYADGSIIHLSSFRDKHSFVHRSDVLNLFYRHATRAGAEILGDDTFDQIQEGENSVQLRLQSGKVLEADVVIGADGINSRVRGYIPSAKDVHPEVTGECTFLIDVPKSRLDEDPSTADLYEVGKTPFHFWWGPERCIIGWTMENHETYHLQFVDFNKEIKDTVRDEGESSNLVTSFSNMRDLRKRWSDHDYDVRRIMDGTEKCIKWKMARLPVLSKWSSPLGRIILIGDAAHAFKPYAAQGACTAIEDATVLATLISKAAGSTSFVEISEAYERLRMPRLSGMREIIEPNAAVFSMPDGPAQRERDAKLKESGNEAEADEVNPAADFNQTNWTSTNIERWVKDYDALAEASKVTFAS